MEKQNWKHYLVYPIIVTIAGGIAVLVFERVFFDKTQIQDKPAEPTTKTAPQDQPASYQNPDSTPEIKKIIPKPLLPIPQPTPSIDKSGCWIKVGFSTDLYLRAELPLETKIGTLPSYREYKVIRVAPVSFAGQTDYFFKIKDEELGEGWVWNFGLESVSRKCY